MNEKIKSKIKESLSAILPIFFVVLALAFTVAPISSDVMSSFFVGTLLLVIGMGIFTLGVEMSMSMIGHRLGTNIAKSKNIFYIFIIIFLLGTIITIAEPDLRILASQITSIPSNLTTICVATGVGLFLVIAFFRIILKINISYLLFFFYALVFILAAFVPKDFWAIAFDAGGVTTGPITVPFILALGIGATSIRESFSSENDSFGLVALCSIGPIITMLILGMVFNLNDFSYSMYDLGNFNTTKEIGLSFLNAFPKYILEVGIAILPILVFFIIYQITELHIPKTEVSKIVIGTIYTFIGLVLFLVGANIGFLPAGYKLGTIISHYDYIWIIIPIGTLIGYFIVTAEPAVLILTKQIADITDGGIPEKAMKFSLSISIALATGISMIRLLTGISIMYFLIPGYALAIILSFFTPKIFTAIAFDSGGVATGPITTTFLIPFSIGICTELGHNVLTDAFGIVALIAMMPLISVQISGIIYKIKKSKLDSSITENSENEIINIDWSEILD